MCLYREGEMKEDIDECNRHVQYGKLVVSSAWKYDSITPNSKDYMVLREVRIQSEYRGWNGKWSRVAERDAQTREKKILNLIY